MAECGSVVLAVTLLRADGAAQGVRVGVSAGGVEWGVAAGRGAEAEGSRHSLPDVNWALPPGLV